jgi:hypothetical protein
VERTKELTCVEALGEGAGLPKEVLAERAHQAGGERTPLPADLPLLGSHLSPPPATTTSFSWTILVRRGGRGESRIREASRWPEGRRRGGRRRRLQGRRRRSSGEARGCGGGDRQRKFEPCINRGRGGGDCVWAAPGAVYKQRRDQGPRSTCTLSGVCIRCRIYVFRTVFLYCFSIFLVVPNLFLLIEGA